MLIELLKEKGLLQKCLRQDSNPCGRGKHGWPIELAKGGGHKEIAELLEAEMKNSKHKIKRTESRVFTN